MLIEIRTFRLVSDADEAMFLEADRRVQAELASHHAGFIRRTTARAGDGEWAVVVLWQAEGDADASTAQAATHPATTQLSAFVDPVTERVQRFHTLD